MMMTMSLRQAEIPFGSHNQDRRKHFSANVAEMWTDILIGLSNI
jgi:hypothetical protein